jgi:CBS domain-containing protein
VADRTIAHLTERLAGALEHAARDPEPQEQPSPGGLLVRDVMTPGPLLLHEDMPLKTAALLLFHYDVAGAPVCGDAGGLTGVLSEADLIDVEAPWRYGLSRDVDASRRRKTARTVGQACTRPAREVAMTAPVRRAAELMRDHDVARLVVVDDSQVVGVVSRHDVLKAILRADAEIQAALGQLLAEQDQDEVVGTVEWGIAYLTGRVSTRSAHAEILERVEEVDGVVAVDSDLTWDVDDVTPPLVPVL